MSASSGSVDNVSAAAPVRRPEVGYGVVATVWRWVSPSGRGGDADAGRGRAVGKRGSAVTGDNAITAVGQAGDAGSKDPAEGSVAAGENADPTDAGQSSESLEAADGSAGQSSADGASSQEPAEGPA